MAGTAISERDATEQRKTRAGLGYGLAAYTMWGVFPIYFRALTHVSPWVIVGHRIIWSAVFLSIMVSLRPLPRLAEATDVYDRPTAESTAAIDR